MSPFRVLLLCVSFVISIGFLSHWLDTKKSSKGSVEAFLEPLAPITLTHENSFISLSPEEKNCLALNVYHEAKHEPYIGKIAVIQVTHHRVLKNMRGSTYCEVVFAPHQFSWTQIKKMRNELPKGQQWESSKHAVDMFTRGVRTTLNTSDHYFADYIQKPEWARSMQYDGQVAKHVFYTSR